MKVALKIIAALGISGLVFAIFGTAYALTINTYNINYSLTSLKSVTSDALKLDHDYQKLSHTTSYMKTDADNGTYIRVSVKQKKLLGYDTIATFNFTDPVVNGTGTTSYYNFGADTYKYEIYDYSIAEIRGTVKVYNADSV